MKSRMIGGVFVLCGILTACSGGGLWGPPFDESALLSTIDFDKPLTRSISVSIYNLYSTTPDSNSQQDRCILSNLAKSGNLSAIPDPNNTPWFQIANAKDGQLIVNFGSRDILNRTNVTKWSVGPVKYYAENINYNIKSQSRIQNSTVSSVFGPFNARIIFENDPAVGVWKVSSQTGSIDTSIEQGLIIKEMIPVGNCDTKPLYDVLSKAQAVSYDMIEKILKNNGTLERKAPFLLVSAKNKMAYYNAPLPFQQASIRQLMAYCSNIKVPGFKNWHLPTRTNMQSLIASWPPAMQGHLIDAPDGRLWGAMGNPSGNWEFATSEIEDNGGNFYSVYNMPDVLYNVSAPIFYISNDGSINSNALSIAVGNVAGNQLLDAPYFTHGEGQAVCVTEL